MRHFQGSLDIQGYSCILFSFILFYFSLFFFKMPFDVSYNLGDQRMCLRKGFLAAIRALGSSCSQIIWHLL